jgi:hypothetical protein
MGSDRERTEAQDPDRADPYLDLAERNPIHGSRDDIRSIADDRGGEVDEEPVLEELDEEDLEDDDLDDDDEEDLDEEEDEEE